MPKAPPTTLPRRESAVGSTDRFLRGLWWIGYLAVLGLTADVLRQPAVSDSARSLLFAGAAHITYGAFYLAPAWLLTAGCRRLCRRPWVCSATAAAGVGLTLVLLDADGMLFRLFGFHVNGFVVNLLLTPGGIDSLGDDGPARAAFALRAALLLAAPFAFWWAAARWRLLGGALDRLPVLRTRYALLAFLVLTVGERGLYAVSHLQGYTPVLAAAEAVWLYQPLNVTKAAQRLGIRAADRVAAVRSPASPHIQYPLKPLVLSPPPKPPNLLVLVAESWRADMLDPGIMPETWAFAQRSGWFTRHYSGGNGTRMGLFTLFYGIHGPYWFGMLAARRPPVLMQVMERLNYQWDMHTSAKFSYPEFDRTIFAPVASSHLHDDNTTPGWADDRRHVADLMHFIANRDPERPFMAFMFFESPHARYYFPEESVIRRDYLEEFNYATMDLARDIGRIKNRYINSCRHLDTQLGRLFRFLDSSGLLAETIVLVTGDHGEEFLEKGRWGHNSEFHEEQLRVPFLLHLPGVSARRYDHATSHIDFTPTILPFFGVQNPAGDYSLGKSLLDESPRPYLVSSDWSSIAVIDEEFKARMPLSNSGVLRNRFTTREDAPVDGKLYMQTRKRQLVSVLEELRRFSAR